MFRRTASAVIIAMLLACILTVAFNVQLVVHAPPPLPMTISGYVTIQTASGTNMTAPPNLTVYTKQQNTTIPNNPGSLPTNDQGYYIISVGSSDNTVPPEGTPIDIWVQGINITRIIFHYKAVIDLNLTVKDTTAPTIQVLSPQPQAYVNSTQPVWVNATATDDLAINETSITMTLNQTQLAWTFNNTTGLLSSQTGPLAQGLYIANITVSDIAGNTAVQTWNFTARAPFPTFLTVMSEYRGYFIQNLPLNNTFGLYTEHERQSPNKVNGILSDVEGSRNVSFSNVTDPSGAYLSEPVDMGSLSLNATLQVFVVYSDGTIVNTSYPIKVIQTPSWLISILNAQANVTVEPQVQGQWDNTYKIHVEKNLDLSGIFNIAIPLPEFEGGGNYTLLPSVDFGFSFYSNGTCEISSSGIGKLAPMQFGVASVTAHINVTVTGAIALENDSITWVSASFSLDVGASASMNFPIVGYNFGGVTIGLSARVTFNADFGATIVLAPTQNNSEEFISGIGIMIQSINGTISFGAGIAVTAGCIVASVTGEGDIEVNVYLQATQPYIYEFTVIGKVSIYYHFLWWRGTLWSDTGTLYQWSDGTGGDPDPTNFTVTARYYNTSDYEEFTWTNGSLAGPAIHNIYPLTRISAASSGDNAYILYTDDNVSMPVQSGLYWTGLEFNSSQGTLGSLSLPAISDEVFFSPVVISLPNGSLLAMWDSIPLSEANNVTDPLDINTVIPQYSCFDTNTQSWGTIENLVQSGVTTSYLLSSDSTGCYALALQGDSLFSNNQSLVEYDLQSGFELLSISVTNASNIVSFDCVSRLAVLQMLDGSYELLNLSSSQLINLPSVEGCQVKIVQLATNSTDSIGVLYSSNATSGIFSIYNISSSTISFSMNVSQSTNSLTLTHVESGYQLVTADSSGITSYLIEGQVAEQTAFYSMGNITSMGSTNTEKGILVYTTENYGNSSYPLLDLTLTYIIHDVAVTSVVAGPSVVCQGYGCAIEASLANIGDFPETFNVTIYANNTDNGNVTAIHTFVNVPLNGHDSTMLTFMWDTTGFDLGNYVISVYATPVAGEINIADNTLASNAIQIIAGMTGGSGGRMPYMD